MRSTSICAPVIQSLDLFQYWFNAGKVVYMNIYNPAGATHMFFHSKTSIISIPVFCLCHIEIMQCAKKMHCKKSYGKYVHATGSLCKSDVRNQVALVLSHSWVKNTIGQHSPVAEREWPCLVCQGCQLFCNVKGLYCQPQAVTLRHRQVLVSSLYRKPKKVTPMYQVTADPEWYRF